MIKYYNKKYIFIITAVIILILSYTIIEEVKSAKITGEKEAYQLEAKDINYNFDSSKIEASGDVQFQYQDLIITGFKLVVNVKNGEITAYGQQQQQGQKQQKLTISTAEQQLSGNHLVYNYKQGSGKIFGADSKISNLNFSGGSINIVQDKEYSLKIKKSSFTPCILPDPHYQIKAESIKIYPENKILAKNIELWWGTNKLITLPSYVIYYEKVGDEMKFSHPFPFPEIGFNSKAGFLFNIHYPYQIDDIVNGTLILAYTQRGRKSITINNKIGLDHNLNYNNKYIYDNSEEYHHQLINKIDYKKNELGINIAHIFKKDTKTTNRRKKSLISSELSYQWDEFDLKIKGNYYLKNKLFTSGFFLNLPEFYHIKSKLILKQVLEQDQIINQQQFKMTSNQAFKINNNVKLDIKETLRYNLYNWKNSDKIIGSKLSFFFKSPPPESGWDLNLAGEYSLNNDHWNNIKLGIERKYDCYSIDFNYDIIDDIIDIGIKF